MCKKRKVLKVLRVGMTYPRDINPGMGLHAYYYSLFSHNEERILIRKRNGIRPENRSGVEIFEIEVNENELGKYNNNMLKRIILLLKKVKNQMLFFIKAKPYIAEFKPDIVHVFSPIPMFCGIYAKKKCGAKIVMSLHGSDALRIGKVKLFGNILKIPDAIVIVGEEMLSMLPDIKTKKPIVCIGNGVDMNIFKNMYKERKKQFIHVANLRWQKGQVYLLEGFAKFYKIHNDYKLIIIGDGAERSKLTELCVELNIQEAVEFKGICGRQYIAEEMNQSKALILTSISEGFPKVIIEAMATGTPVISSDVGNVKRVVGDSGIIFPMKDSVAAHKAMEEIINEEEWTKMSKKAEKIATNYSWRAVVDRLDNIYYDLVGEKDV